MKRMGSTGAWLNRCLWLASLLLVLFIAFLGASMVQSYRRLTHPAPGAFAPSPPASLSETLPPPVFTDYQSIAARNLFNTTPSQSPAPQPASPTVDQPLQTQPLSLQLVGSVTSTQGHQYAIIADLTKQGVQAVYQIGDSIQQAWLVDIQPTCVLLDRGGQEEALCFSNNEPVEKKRQRRTVRQPASSRAPDNADARPLQGDGR
jgi:type II secretory pathway component PulC